MGIVTRVDADIQHYFQVILEQDHVEEGDIQRLLDAYREKFEVDFVYGRGGPGGPQGALFHPCECLLPPV